MKITIDTSKVYDLTRAISPEVAGVTWRPAKIFKKDGWNARTLELYSHSGTHMDAPYHFEVSPATIDQYPASRFFGIAHILDITSTGKQQLLKVEDLHPYWGKIKPGDSVLIRMGWDHTFGTKNYTDGLPRIGEELAQRLVETKINMLAVEGPSVADVNNLPEVTRIHEILLGGDVIIIEGLMNTHMIKGEKVFLVALPLKVKDGDGAPARVMALELE